ncbi:MULTISPECIES: ketoacyl-ACP synthase III family protein [unclassified Micromonospora]|uniref:ketoacyl-ACP synthase III family protein n=1 Tax=unclassified Micromonospora TaxID=2617518 RepID=UPI0021045B95|nr:ketoacyl-ACP synthase III family protein [Micromonospora sp. RL09-050-HVF-A]
MKVQNVFVAGVGTYLPDRITTEEAVKRGWYDEANRTHSDLHSIAVAADMPAPDMAFQAASEAMKRSAHRPEDVAALMHCPVHYQGPDTWSAPHYILHETLGGRGVPALEIHHGCNGMLSGLRLAAAQLMADPESTAVLLTAADNFSTPVVDRWRISSHYVLADGASAALLSTRGGFAELLAVGSASNPAAEVLHRGGEPLFPPSITTGQRVDLEARSRYWAEQWANGVTPPVFHLGDLVTETVDRVLDEAGVTMAGIARVAHSGVALDQLQNGIFDPLGITAEQTVWDFSRTVGHCGASDQILALDHLVTTGAVGPGDHVLLLAVGVGIEVGCAVVKIIEEHR